MAITKIDSNATGLSICEELSPKVLPTTPVWFEQEPNSFNAFGGDYKTVARSPLTVSRQKKKGVMSDLDASGGFQSDVVIGGLPRLAQGFFFADAREKACTQPVNGSVSIPLTAVTSTTFTAASGLDIFKTGDLSLIHI